MEPQLPAPRLRALACIVMAMAAFLPLQGQTQPGVTAAEPPQSAAEQRQSFYISGVVKSGNTPIPGVTVTAANTLTGKKTITSTGVDGSYALELTARGRYVVRAEMTSFAPVTQEVILNASTPKQQANFSLVLLSRAPKPEQSPAGTPANGTLARTGRGPQQLNVIADESGLSAAGTGDNGGEASLGSLAGLAGSADATNQSVTAGGQLGTLGGPFGGARTSEELRERMQEMRDQRNFAGGGPGPGGPPGGLGAGGPFVIRSHGFDVNKPHGTFYYSAGNSLFDAMPYSINGASGVNPAGSSNRFGGLIGGPLNIPHVVKDDKTFFFGGYTGTRVNTPYVAYSNVPTLDERNGIFSTPVYCPAGSTACAPGAQLTPAQIQAMTSPAALALLNNNYIPQPNQTGLFNYRYANSLENNTDNLFLRLTHNFGGGGFGPFGGGPGGGRGSRRSRNNLNFNFNWLRAENQAQTSFPTVGGTTNTSSFNTGVGWAAGKGNWNNTLRVNFNRQRVDTTNLYAGIPNFEQNLGIYGASTNPLDSGLPNLSIAGFTGLTDIAPVYRNDSTLQFSEMAVWTKNKHNVRFGGDFRRLWTTLRSNADPRGTFTFTGFATGNAFADFLLGYPQSTALQYSSTPYSFSTNSYDLFVTDDWRVRSNFTLQLGLRYEYIAPYTEQNNRMANLIVAPDLNACAAGPSPQSCVVPVTGSGLIQPDRNNFGPRVGFAWKVQSNTVVRGGYGINYNVSEYSTIITQLAYQPPFSTALTPIAATPGALTLQNGFPAPLAGSITNSYAVSPNLKLPYVQIWNLNVQHEFGNSLVVNVGYNGSKGTDLDIVTMPNRTPTGLLLSSVQPFQYLVSGGSSILHAGSLRVRKRLSHGLSVGGTYVFSKSIDNASSIGGGAVMVAQNPLNLAAERGLSSFDQRHKFTGDFLYELPFGTNKRWLSASGPMARVFGNWTWSGSFTIASGTPLTPYVLNSIADVARGSSGSLRPDLTGLPLYPVNLSPGLWFNPAAFVTPPVGQYGNAGRNIIIGPGTILFNMSMAKTIPFKDTKSLEFRVTANNVFNHPNYTGVDMNVNSPTFGRLISAGNMRQLLFSSRFRF